MELDDRFHDMANDAWHDRLTVSAGYRTVRLPTSERPTRDSVRRRVSAVLV